MWHTDCNSLYDTLQKPVAKTVNKRRGIVLAGLRQFLWRKVGNAKPDRNMLQEEQNDPTDLMRLIDTVVMVADPLTKSMKEDFMLQVLNSNMWNYGQPEHAKFDKARKQWLRRRSKQGKDSCQTDGSDEN